MKYQAFVVMLSLILSFSTQKAQANHNDESLLNLDIKCTPVKRVGSQANQIERGIAIYFELVTRNSKGQIESSTPKFTQKLWFGNDLTIRSQALNACERGRSVLECRQDGPEQTSYFRGGSQSKIRLWALHGPNIYETFSDPAFWGDSAYLQCQKRIIEHIASMIQQLQ
jgi:hypothetical protein